MSVNGKNGSITYDTLAAQGAVFATLTGYPNIVDGTVVAVGLEQGFGTNNLNVALQAPGDPGGFVPIAAFALYSGDDDIATRILKSAKMPDGGTLFDEGKPTGSMYTYAQLQQSTQPGTGWTDPRDGVERLGAQAVADSFDYWLWSNTGHACLAATSGAWVTTSESYLQIYVNAALAQATVTPYAAPTPATLTGEFDLTTNCFQNATALEIGWGLLLKLNSAPGALTVGFNPAPAS